VYPGWGFIIQFTARWLDQSLVLDEDEPMHDPGALR